MSLRFLCVQPDDTYFIWQVHLWLESLKNIGHSDKAIVLVFTPNYRQTNSRWAKLMDLYPETTFEFYKDEHGVSSKLGIYIPVLRPYTLWRYMLDYPGAGKGPLFYCDCDILFRETFDVEKYKEDDINYLSDTNSYINATYFDSKIKDVLPDKVESYKTRDILEETAGLVGITRQICEENNLHSGGTQYFLKDTDAKFWEKVMNDCISIRTHLQNVNKEFFESENKGFQSWCADMWAVLYNLWLRGQTTRVVPEMDFGWSTDSIDRVYKLGIFHNAGISSTVQNGHPCFYKGKYIGGTNPFTDEHLDNILNNEESKKFGTWYYASKLDELRKKYDLNYF